MHYVYEGYRNLFGRAQVLPSKQGACMAVVHRILESRARYEAIERQTRVPWWFVACLHYRESNLDFGTYLGNGQSLHRKTTEVPAGRGPFANFEHGAYDALEIQGFARVTDWSIEHALFEAEAFNGFGYVRYGVNSPYVWAATDQYERGKFVSDGRFSASTIDPQLGVASIVKTLMIACPNIFPQEKPAVTTTPAPASTTIDPAAIEAFVAAISSGIAPIAAAIPALAAGEKLLAAALPEAASLVTFAETFTGATAGEQIILAIIQGLEKGLGVTAKTNA